MRDMILPENGSAFVSALIWVFVTCTLVSAMVYASRLNLETDNRQVEYIHAYAIASGLSHRVIRSIVSNEKDVAIPSVVDGMRVQYERTQTNSDIAVKMEVGNSWVQDTITFTYDTIAHRLILWQDNGPGF